MATYVLYNSLSGGGAALQESKILESFFAGETLNYIDVISINGYETFFAGIQKEDKVVLCGGDGTINFFANATKDLEIENEIYYYPAGTGTDFWPDIQKDKANGPVLLNDY